MRKDCKLNFNFEIHSFKHLYNNCNLDDIVDYIVFLQKLYYKIFKCNKYIISGSNKSDLIRIILDLEQSIITYVFCDD